MCSVSNDDPSQLGSTRYEKPVILASRKIYVAVHDEYLLDLRSLVVTVERFYCDNIQRLI